MRRALPPFVTLLLAGNGLLSMLRFMVWPFMALYLRAATGAPPALVGLVIGVGSLSSLIFAFVFGPLSDRIGRKPSILIGTFLSGVLLAAFGLVHSLVLFALLQVLFGIAFALDGPAYQALLTDLTPVEDRVRIFGYDYWIANVGAAIGPLIGTAAGSGHSPVPFIVVGSGVILAAAVFTFLLPKNLGYRPERNVSTVDSFRHLGEGLGLPVFRGFLLAAFFGALAYAQIGTNVAQYLGYAYTSGATLYALILSANAVSVLILQPLAARWQGRRPLLTGVVTGAGIYAVMSAVFGLDQAWVSWILTMAVFTVGEVLLSPTSQAVVSILAPESRRATYFTLQSFSWGLASSVGPALGGMALQSGGRWGLFGMMALANVVSLSVYLASLGRDPRFSRREREGVADARDASFPS